MAPPSSRHLMSHLIQLSPWGAEGISSCGCGVSSGAREKSIRSHGSRGSSAAGAGYFGGAALSFCHSHQHLLWEGPQRFWAVSGCSGLMPKFQECSGGWRDVAKSGEFWQFISGREEGVWSEAWGGFGSWGYFVGRVAGQRFLLRPCCLHTVVYLHLFASLYASDKSDSEDSWSGLQSDCRIRRVSGEQPCKKSLPRYWSSGCFGAAALCIWGDLKCCSLVRLTKFSQRYLSHKKHGGVGNGIRGSHGITCHPVLDKVSEVSVVEDALSSCQSSKTAIQVRWSKWSNLPNLVEVLRKEKPGWHQDVMWHQDGLQHLRERMAALVEGYQVRNLPP